VIHNLCITEGTQCMVFIQSCTVSLPVLQYSCSESSVTCIDAYDVLSMNREDCDMHCQGEEIPIAISFPKIECEEDKLSYICMSIVRCIVSISRNSNCQLSSPYLCRSVHLKSSTAVNRNFFMYFECLKHL
jgi:hypothetical protein